MCQIDRRASFISLIMMIFVFLASSDGVTSGKHQQIFVMRETAYWLFYFCWARESCFFLDGDHLACRREEKDLPCMKTVYMIWLRSDKPTEKRLWVCENVSSGWADCLSSAISRYTNECKMCRKFLHVNENIILQHSQEKNNKSGKMSTHYCNTVQDLHKSTVHILWHTHLYFCVTAAHMAEMWECV